MASRLMLFDKLSYAAEKDSPGPIIIVHSFEAVNKGESSCISGFRHPIPQFHMVAVYGSGQRHAIIEPSENAKPLRRTALYQAISLQQIRQITAGRRREVLNQQQDVDSMFSDDALDKQIPILLVDIPKEKRGHLTLDRVLRQQGRTNRAAALSMSCRRFLRRRPVQTRGILPRT